MTTMDKVGNLESISIDALIPYARNSRTHSDAQVAQIAASIKEFGFTNPVLIDEDGGIIAGHGRTLAARKLGLDEVPCLRLSHFSEIQKRAYVIADNKLALNAGWDDELLKLELHALDENDLNLALTGFDGEELAKIMFGEIIDPINPDEFGGDSSNKWQLLIEYDSESQLAQAFDETKERGLKCKIIQ